MDSRDSSSEPPRAGQKRFVVEALPSVCLFHPPPPPALSIVTHVGVIFFLRVNWGRGRQIPNPVRERKEKVFVHRSVKTRMEAVFMENGKYNPKAKFEHRDVDWVD